MVMIRIRDHVARASSYEDGDVIFRLLSDRLSAGESVDVSFEGITSVPSAFVNAAFVRVLESMRFDDFRSRVRFCESTRSINEILRSRLEFVGRGEAAQ